MDKALWLLFTGLAVVACSDKDDDDDDDDDDDTGPSGGGFGGGDGGDQDDTGGGGDGGGGDGGGNQDFAVGYAWDASGIAVSITGGDPGGYWFGMAETGAGSDGWYAEDCFSEQAGYAFCHEFGATGGSLQSVDRPDDVRDSATTLFWDAYAANITYYLEDVAGNCYTWGQDTSYYSCDVLAR